MANKKRRALPTPRVFPLHAHFTPDGPDPAETSRFSEFWLAAQERLRAAERLALKRSQAQAGRKAAPILGRMLRDEISLADGAAELRRVIPDPELARAVFDDWAAVAGRPPEELRAQRRALAQERARHRRVVRWHRAKERIDAELGVLAEAAAAGEAEAVRALVEAATSAAGLVEITEGKQSERCREVAAGLGLWPMLARDEEGWEKGAVERWSQLGLGRGLARFEARFRPATGTALNRPARRWAMAAVRTLEESQFRQRFLADVVRRLGSKRAFAEFLAEAGWRLEPGPDWAKGLDRLAPFSAESLPEWKAAVRALVTEQVPDLHTHPDWGNARNAAESSGRPTPGGIRGAILDGIVSALKTVAPDKALPKSGS
jgi:hypothetical protein